MEIPTFAELNINLAQEYSKKRPARTICLAGRYFFLGFKEPRRLQADDALLYPIYYDAGEIAHKGNP